jgi:NADH:quinone reductase (non-electrogenic)
MRTGNPYPPTAQNALRQARVAANNLITLINAKGKQAETETDKAVFDYKTKGIMALIGKRNGVGILFGYKVQGFIAWWLWRSYYLGILPTVEKRLRVVVDWLIDLFSKRDVTRIKTLKVNRLIEDPTIQAEAIK